MAGRLCLHQHTARENMSKSGRGDRNVRYYERSGSLCCCTIMVALANSWFSTPTDGVRDQVNEQVFYFKTLLARWMRCRAPRNACHTFLLCACAVCGGCLRYPFALNTAAALAQLLSHLRCLPTYASHLPF